jgi:hypothetical protein
MHQIEQLNRKLCWPLKLKARNMVPGIIELKVGRGFMLVVHKHSRYFLC